MLRLFHEWFGPQWGVPVGIITGVGLSILIFAGYGVFVFFRWLWYRIEDNKWNTFRSYKKLPGRSGGFAR